MVCLHISGKETKKTPLRDILSSKSYTNSYTQLYLKSYVLRQPFGTELLPRQRNGNGQNLDRKLYWKLNTESYTKSQVRSILDPYTYDFASNFVYNFQRKGVYLICDAYFLICDGYNGTVSDKPRRLLRHQRAQAHNNTLYHCQSPVRWTKIETELTIGGSSPGN
jgi:hypothetical protein